MTIMTRTYKMVTKYYIMVDGRVFQTTESLERRDELLDLLPRFYTESEIWAESRRERRYL